MRAPRRRELLLHRADGVLVGVDVGEGLAQRLGRDRAHRLVVDRHLPGYVQGYAHMHMHMQRGVVCMVCVWCVHAVNRHLQATATSREGHLRALGRACQVAAAAVKARVA